MALPQFLSHSPLTAGGTEFPNRCRHTSVWRHGRGRFLHGRAGRGARAGAVQLPHGSAGPVQPAGPGRQQSRPAYAQQQQQPRPRDRTGGPRASAATAGRRHGRHGWHEPTGSATERYV